MAKLTFKESFKKARDRVWDRKSKRITLHRSFKRSYREDYERPLEVSGLVSHAMQTFKIIFKQWRLFLPLVIFTAIANIVLVGIMSEDTYVQFQDTLDETTNGLVDGKLGQVAKASLLLVSTITTGGLSQGLSEVQQVFAMILFLVVWLVTTYLVRHTLAGHHPKLRDGFYNALTPLISTLIVTVVILIQLAPIAIVVVTYAAAVATEFLNTPFYALVYFIFAALLILLSLYLVSSSILALVAVTAPGLYPMSALRTTANLAAGRRTKIAIRLVFLVFVLSLTWILVGVPLILIDLGLKAVFSWLEGVPFIPLVVISMMVFTIIYVATYSYLYYRKMLNHDK